MSERGAPAVAKELVARLPRTFGPALNDQLKQWALLFPAEQRRLKAQLDWLSRLPPAEFEQLFASLVEIESKMDLPRWTSNSAGLTVEETGILARSPYYPQWRTAAEKVFSRIDDGVEEPEGCHRRRGCCFASFRRACRSPRNLSGRIWRSREPGPLFGSRSARCSRGWPRHWPGASSRPDSRRAKARGCSSASHCCRHWGNPPVRRSFVGPPLRPSGASFSTA